MALRQTWSAVVLAGDRGPGDVVATIARSSCKATAHIGGQPMLARVFQALTDAARIGRIFVCGPQQDRFSMDRNLQMLLERFNITYIEPASGPSRSARKAITQIQSYPVLLLTCDLPLISSNTIDTFCDMAESEQCDLMGSFVPFPLIQQKLPGIRKTVYKQRGESICFTNLFAVNNAQGLHALDCWVKIENERKQPLKILGMLGWTNVMRYKFGRLDFEQESELISSVLGCRTKLVRFDRPDAAIDVDSEEDYRLLDEFLKQTS